VFTAEKTEDFMPSLSAETTGEHDRLPVLYHQ